MANDKTPSMAKKYCSFLKVRERDHHAHHRCIARLALGLFLLHWMATALWTWLFFSWRLGVLAFIEIPVLWVLIAALIVAFWRLNKTAALMLTPYLTWVSFATALTYSV